jgi:DNA ligase N terminus
MTCLREYKILISTQYIYKVLGVLSVKTNTAVEMIEDENDSEEELPMDVAEEESEVLELDDPVAEGDEPPPPRLEPSEQKASSMKFHTLCVALETVWNAGVQKKNWSDVQKLWKILPPKFLQWLDTPSDDGRPESIFPILRLLLPEKDGSRQFQMAESTLGVMYGTALGFSVQSNKYGMLLRYSDPNSGLTKAQGLGDFSIVVQTVVGFTKVSSPNNGSGYTVGRINEALDLLASLPGKARQLKSNHDWKKDGDDGKPKAKAPTLKTLRARWLRQLNEGSTNCTGLSPLEHKWLVRIMLKKLQFGLVRT